MKIIKKLFVLFICAGLIAGCSATESKTGAENETADRSETVQDSPGDVCEIKYVDMDQSEEKQLKNRISEVMDSCRTIYDGVWESTDSAAPDEEKVHRMAAAAASDGAAVTCGNYDYNMLNYEEVDHALRDAVEGREAAAEFFVLTSEGYFKYFRLRFLEEEMTVSYVSAAFDGEKNIQIRELEKYIAYDWEYTEKGWLIWEKALSRNQEMDMHVFVRIQPLEDVCREMGNEYILPVSYFCNNLFLTDWDEGSMEEIEFNDLFDFVYEMKYGEALDGTWYKEGVPKKEFEEIVCTYFDISVEELEKCAGYDAEKDVYPWEEIGPWNRVQQFQPFPEVVRCEESEDGTRILYVEAVFIETGSDCSFRHKVTMKQEGGRWLYTGNQVERGEDADIPGYKPRSEF